MVSVYYMDIGSVKIDQLLSNFAYLISNERLKKMKSFKFEEDKIRSLVAELLLVKALKKEPFFNYEKIRYRYNDFGKPFLIDFSKKFSLSHSGNYVLCAVSDHNVGVDIEKINRCTKELVELFHIEEIKKFKTIPDQKKDIIFFDLWSKKESYVKYLGLGLSKHFNSFETRKIGRGEFIVLNNDKIVENILIKEINIDSRYSSAVCVFKEAKIKLNKVSLSSLMQELAWNPTVEPSYLIK
ncbi:putative 4'-phosphopantetheinyl transferase gsp [Carnobacterium maltaromaticum]|uniref:4'-phosphopantetheinyl transferase family protein n=1 Tax=Carnobacterium maltaromaticum TaxID=2751 RepID=UPI00191B9135|nr:4'-phosphopantetheinyl transferase superfamily protein [Carnobacterium maltaromaticum]CAD5901757.1 putative 4'-phosphopantetheinyl transferase gsp [Carnobacterium maltaromaticum]